MRLLICAAATAALAGCASRPVDPAASLSAQDPKWASAECQQARAAAADYEVRAKDHLGWGSSLLLGPYSLALVAATKEGEKKLRKRLAREVHLQCSSLPLPKNLEDDAIVPVKDRRQG